MVSAEKAQEVTHYMVIACVSVFFFDYIQTLPDEFRMYYNRGWSAFKSPIVWIFLTVRYFTVLNGALDIYINADTGFKPYDTCVAMVRIPLLCLLVANYSANCLFTLRAYALSNRNKWVAIFLLVLAGFQIPPGISYQFGIQASHASGTTGCAFKSTDMYSMPIFYGMGLLFDLVAFGITTWYLMNGFQRLGFWTPVAKALLEDGLAYLVVAMTVQLLNILFYTAVPRETRLRGVTGPLVFLTAVMAQRVTLHHLTDFQIRGVVRSKFNASSDPGSGAPSRQGLRSYKSSQYGGTNYGQNSQQTQVSLQSPPPTSPYGGYPNSYAGREKRDYEMA